MVFTVVNVIDVNYNSGIEALTKSPSLNGYAYLVSLIRRYMREGESRDKAIYRAVDTCLNENILTDFLRDKHKEVVDMFTYQYDREEELAVVREEAFEEGREKAREEERQKAELEKIELLKTLAKNLNLPLEKIQQSLTP